MFSYVSPEQRIPKGHPLRAIRALVDEVLVDMSREFDRLYATIGRPSIPPERLLDLSSRMVRIGAPRPSRPTDTIGVRSKPDDRPPERPQGAEAGGKSELRRAVRRVTPGQGNLKESGTENIPPAAVELPA